MPQPTTKTRRTVEYECETKDICLPKCSFHFFQKPEFPEDACQVRCGHPRRVNVLMKRVVNEELPATECKPG
ncbi:hypothetical protein ABTM86_20340, partial [Acinetobacter baumannii]